MAALHRTVAFVEMHDIAVRVAENLHLDVPRAGDKALQKNGPVAEGDLRFLLSFFDAAGEFFFGKDDPHAAAAAAESRFDNDRKADFERRLAGCFGVLKRVLQAGDDAHARFLRQPPRGQLVAERFEQFRRRPYKSDARLLAGPRQRAFFRQKAVAGMDGVNAVLLAQGDEPVDVHVGRHRPLALADQVGFIGLETVQAEAVFLGINGGRADAHLVGGA